MKKITPNRDTFVYRDLTYRLVWARETEPGNFYASAVYRRTGGAFEEKDLVAWGVWHIYCGTEFVGVISEPMKSAEAPYVESMKSNLITIGVKYQGAPDIDERFFSALPEDEPALRGVCVRQRVRRPDVARRNKESARKAAFERKERSLEKRAEDRAWELLGEKEHTATALNSMPAAELRREEGVEDTLQQKQQQAAAQAAVCIKTGLSFL